MPEILLKKIYIRFKEEDMVLSSTKNTYVYGDGV